MIRWAILGVGTAGRERARAIARHPQAELVAVCGGRYAQTMNVVVTANPIAAMADADAVAICSASVEHAELAKEALLAKKHVSVEYPVATTATEAQALFELAESQSRILHVGHVELLSASAGAMRAHLKPFAIKRMSITCERTGSDSINGRELALKNVARLHRAVDVAGPIASVDSTSAEPGSLTGHLTFNSGATLEFSFLQASYLRRRNTFVVEDTHGEKWRYEYGTLFRGRHSLTLLEPIPPLELDQNHVMQRILEGTTPYLSPQRIVHILQIVEQMAQAV